MVKKYYAVAKGRNIGIFDNWNDAKKSIDKYSGAVYKSFTTIKEAQEFLDKNTIKKIEFENVAYTDGSFKDGYGGFGVIYFRSDGIWKLYGPVEMIKHKMSNNIAELYAIYVLLSATTDTNILIYTDSTYVINTLVRGYHTNENIELINKIKDLMIDRTIQFKHVDAHINESDKNYTIENQYNNEVDILANLGRESVDIQIYHNDILYNNF